MENPSYFVLQSYIITLPSSQDGLLHHSRQKDEIQASIPRIATYKQIDRRCSCSIYGGDIANILKVSSPEQQRAFEVLLTARIL